MMTVKRAKKFCLIILFLLPLSLPVPRRAFAEPLPLESYRSRIQEIIHMLEAGNGILVPEEASCLRERLPSGLTVGSSEQREVRIDRKTLQTWIRKAQASPEGRSQLITHLEALLRQLKSGWKSVIPSEPDRGKSRAALEEIFRSKEFRHLKERQWPPWVEFFGNLIDRIRKWLGTHLGAIQKLGGAWTLYVIYGIVLLLGGGILARVIRSSGSIGWRRGRKRFGPSPEESSPQAKMDWSKWREDAREMAFRGDYREAVRALFVSSLMEGHQKGWWIYEAESTNGEHLARVEGPGDRREALARLIHLYEQAWYGLGQPDLEVFQSCETWVKRMEGTS